MTYGSMHSPTREWIIKRAAQSNIDLAKLNLDVEFDEETGETASGEQVYEVATIFDGSLDETFYMTGPYEVNVADWIAEQCNEEYQHSTHDLGWDVIVTEYSYQDAGPQKYRVTSDTFQG